MQLVVIIKDGCTVFLGYEGGWWYRSCSIVICNVILKGMGSWVQCTCALCIVVKGILFVITLDAGPLAKNQCPEGPATGHLDTGFLGFPVSLKQMLRWFPCFQVATTCFSCSPPEVHFSNRTTTRLLYTCYKPLPPGSNPTAVE